MSEMHEELEDAANQVNGVSENLSSLYHTFSLTKPPSPQTKTCYSLGRQGQKGGLGVLVWLAVLCLLLLLFFGVIFVILL